jgi:hypothetical protein
MGYELEAPAPVAFPELDGDLRQQALERRWQLTNERLAVALTGCHALRGRVPPDDPAWLAAQLRLAQARQRCREASDDLELYASEVRLSAFRR